MSQLENVHAANAAVNPIVAATNAAVLSSQGVVETSPESRNSSSSMKKEKRMRGLHIQAAKFSSSVNITGHMVACYRDNILLTDPEQIKLSESTYLQHTFAKRSVVVAHKLLEAAAKCNEPEFRTLQMDSTGEYTVDHFTAGAKAYILEKAALYLGQTTANEITIGDHKYKFIPTSTVESIYGSVAEAWLSGQLSISLSETENSLVLKHSSRDFQNYAQYYMARIGNDFTKKFITKVSDAYKQFTLTTSADMKSAILSWNGKGIAIFIAPPPVSPVATNDLNKEIIDASMGLY